MKSRRRLDILTPINRGQQWEGRIGGHAVALWKAKGEVQVWIAKRNGGATFAAPTATEAVRTLEGL